MLVDCVPFVPQNRLTVPATFHNHYWLLLAEGHLTRRLFGSPLRRIAMLPSPAG
jgi:hypothetical protein